MKINEQALNDIIGRLERSWQGDARRAIKRLYELLDKGITTEQAVNKIKKEFPALFALTGLQDAMVEAAAYGYGIMPSILTKAEKATLARSLALAWTSDKMTLSEKIHGLGVRMRDQIVQTINEQLDKNATWKEASLALYDGYTGGGDIIKPQEVPKYIQNVIDAAKDAAGGEKEIAKQAERAAKQAEQLAKNGAPTTALQAAYNQVVEAAESGSQEALEKAIDVAVNEKSRYVADRIIRTETARAYNNGFLSKVMADGDVVALRWKLNTRHPVFDICDMFAKADMFGLGPGIFPKDNLPRTSIPVHPHCMCRFVEVYDGEVDMDKMVDRTQEAGEEWLKKLNDKQQRMVLGVQGQKQFAKDGSWQESMRGWFGTGKPEYQVLDFGGSPSGVKDKYLPKGWEKGKELVGFENDIAACNPKDLGGDRKNNCQRCIVAYEMRRRGYDVVAKPMPDVKTDYIKDEFGWRKLFMNQEWTRCAVDAEGNAMAQQQIEQFLRKSGNGTRVEIYVKWKGEESAHVFIGEQIKGKTYFLDPQTGNKNCDFYFTNAEERDIMFSRIDNLPVSALVKECCEMRQKK